MNELVYREQKTKVEAYSRLTDSMCMEESQLRSLVDLGCPQNIRAGIKLSPLNGYSGPLVEVSNPDDAREILTLANRLLSQRLALKKAERDSL